MCSQWQNDCCFPRNFQRKLLSIENWLLLTQTHMHTEGYGKLHFRSKAPRSQCHSYTHLTHNFTLWPHDVEFLFNRKRRIAWQFTLSQCACVPVFVCVSHTLPINKWHFTNEKFVLFRLIFQFCFRFRCSCVFTPISFSFHLPSTAPIHCQRIFVLNIDFPWISKIH